MNSENTLSLRSVVLVDDDVDFLHVLQHRLQKHRAELNPSNTVEIRSFADPIEALVNLPAQEICVVVLDYRLRDSKGTEWLPKFLKAGLGPVIVLTNDNDAKTAAEIFRNGATDFIGKSEVATEDRRLEWAIREAAQRYRLEERNTSLTRQLKLLNLELEQKNRRLKDLTETAHRFVDDVAHDFRNPLTVIQQYAAIITEGISGPVNDGQRGHLDVISEATRELSEMVDDFLDSSKLRARVLSMRREEHTVSELFASVEATLKVRSEAKRLRIEQVIPETIATFFGDHSKAGRVLTNLAVNAIKVSPLEGQLKLWAKEEENGDIRIGVTDEGPGMEAAEQKIIFERFRQLDEPVLADAKGFGLGLSIVKQLTWLNLGEVEVESEPHRGSTFSFTLPRFDLRRIIDRYLQNIQSFEERGEFWLLQLCSRGDEPNVSELFRLISSFCYPMDLVWADIEGQMVKAIGVSQDPEAWGNRLRNEISAMSLRDDKKNAFELEIKKSGPWSRGTERAVMAKTLFECLCTGRCYVG
jgi:hypothetical protein